LLNLAGQKFGKLFVLKSTSVKYRYLYWLCKCDCGIEKEIRGSHLKSGLIKSCGCEGGIKTHGNSRSDKINFYRVWQGIKTRCYNKNSYPYKDYGARGIRMCDEWLNNFQQFYDDMYPTYSPGLTIERKNVNGNYCKDNCIWIPRSQQGNNRRSTIWVDTLEGKMSIAHAAKKAGISWPAMYVRIKMNWPKEKLLLPATSKGR
jgi:hypothetical protein